MYENDYDATQERDEDLQKNVRSLFWFTFSRMVCVLCQQLICLKP